MGRTRATGTLQNNHRRASRRLSLGLRAPSLSRSTVARSPSGGCARWRGARRRRLHLLPLSVAVEAVHSDLLGCWRGTGGRGKNEVRVLGAAARVFVLPKLARDHRIEIYGRERSGQIQPRRAKEIPAQAQVTAWARGGSRRADEAGLLSCASWAGRKAQ
jgi:hypothetical protein